ncbi:polycystic kidney disease and receptor for egg jelly-related protein-like [Gigantopelta aegis]|uniref:polycystic kidney disease and receptor for egg jelly-related protein-like n=1 Tax=Gigantopelta aegis TaxID=1735272 RepID=UPI001B889D0C|nr:polycystic kidney disease and receptor for egg jelly-related protein-like [Gigantopelta aegis]
MYVTTFQTLNAIDYPVTWYVVLKNQDKRYKYYIDVTETTNSKNTFSCRPTFAQKGKSICSIVAYKCVHHGDYQVKLRHTDGSSSVSSQPSNFSVVYVDDTKFKYFSKMKLSGTDQYLQSPDLKLYNTNKRLNFSALDFTKKPKFTFEYEWTLMISKLNDPEICHQLQDFEIVQIPQQKKSGHLEVPAYYLQDGYFRLCVNVLLHTNIRKKTYKKFACGFFKTFTLPLEVVMVPSESYLSVENHKPVILNASASFDPNIANVSGSVANKINITFQWYCAMQETNASCKFVSRLWPSFVPDPLKPNLIPVTDSVLNIPKRILTVNQTYVLTVNISKPKVPGDNASVTVFSAVSNVPILNIRCIFNCKELVNPTEMLALEVDCENCETEAINVTSYLWMLSSVKSGVIPFAVWKSKSTTGNNQSSQVLLAEALSISAQYVFRLSVSTQKGITENADYKIETNTPPGGGSCFISPKSGRALFTHFKVSCSGFTDIHLPLTYNIYLISEDTTGLSQVFLNMENINRVYVNQYLSRYGYLIMHQAVLPISENMVYHGVKSSVDSLILPQGLKELEFKQTLIVSVKDSLETRTLVSLSVQVFSPLDGDEDRLKLLEEFARNITSTRYKTDDFLTQALFVVIMLGQDDVKTSTLANEEIESSIREVLMEYLKDYDIKDKFVLLRMSQIVTAITSQEQKLSKNMEKHALIVVNQLADGLKRTSKTFPSLSRHIGFLQFHTVDMLVNLVSKVAKSESVPVLTTESPPSTSELPEPTTELPEPTTKSPEERKKLKAMMQPFLQLFEKLGDTMLSSFLSKDEEPISIQSDHAAMATKWSDTGVEDIFLSEHVLADENVRGTFAMPMASTFSKYNKENNSSVQSVDVQMQIIENNPYIWAVSEARTNLPVMQILIKDRGKKETLSLSKLSIPADIFISVNISNLLENDQVYTLHASYANQKVLSSNAMQLAIPPVVGKTNILRIFPKQTSLKLQVFLGTRDVEVNLENIKQNGYSWPITDKALLTYKLLTQDPELLFLTEDVLGVNQTNFTVGVRVKSGQNIEHQDGETGTVAIEFGVQTFTAECFYWNEKVDDWRQDGCMVSPFTTLKTLHCWCDHLTAFTGGVFIIPNTVDPVEDIYLFLTFFDNPIVVTMIVGVWILYFMILYWAHKVDHEDLQKKGVTLLHDSNPTNHYMYLICVVTGWWHEAGTTSKVFAYICGQDGMSDRHALYDSERQLFSSGAEDWFLLKTADSLGKIQSVVFWHDNSGHRPSWYLKEVVVMDLQTNETWHCLYDDWLSLVKGHQTVTADIPAIESKTFASRHYYQFSQMSSQNLRSGHLWISIFSKPAISTFTRKQRLTCALCLLVSTMLANIMYHGVPRDDPADQIDYGDFRLSLSDFLIGMQCSLILFPINMIIVYLFTSVKPRQKNAPVCGAKVEKSDSASVSPSYSLGSLATKKQESKGKCFLNLSLPWYFLYVAYFIAITTALICSYFVMLYGLKYGYNKSLSWLISFFTSFFQSALIIQPLKVFFVAFLVTLLLKQPVEYKSGMSKKELDEDEEYLHQEILKREGIFPDDDSNQMHEHYMPPLSRSSLKGIRKRIILEQRTREILLEIIMYFTFVVIVLMVVLGHSDVTEAFYATKGIHDIFIEAVFNDNGVPFYDVTNAESMLEYLNLTLLSNLMSDSQGNALHQDSHAYLVGRARLRQIRILNTASCVITSKIASKLKSTKACLEAFTTDAMDTQIYGKNWRNRISANESTMWTYQSGIELHTLSIMGKLATYPGGGYVLQFPRNAVLAHEVLEDMRNTSWIDEYTRAVFVEFTVFNPSVHLFTVAELIFEFSNTGFVYPYHQIYTSNFYHYQNEFETFVAACEVLFVLYLVTFTYWEIEKIRKLKWVKYFSDSWNIVEVIILSLSYTIIGLFINRLIICSHLMSKFSDSDYEKFVSFYTPAFFGAVLRYVMGVLNLFTIIKFFKLLRFNVRLTLFAQTINYAKGKLVAYSIGLIGITMAFSMFALLLFGYTLKGYRNFSSTMISMFIFMLGESDYYGLAEGDAILGPAFFFLFSLTFQFIFMQYFITLLMDAFNKTQTDIATMKTEVHMLQYIIRKFYLLLMLDNQKPNLKKAV